MRFFGELSNYYINHTLTLYTKYNPLELHVFVSFCCVCGYEADVRCSHFVSSVGQMNGANDTVSWARNPIEMVIIKLYGHLVNPVPTKPNNLCTAHSVWIACMQIAYVSLIQIMLDSSGILWLWHRLGDTHFNSADVYISIAVCNEECKVDCGSYDRTVKEHNMGHTQWNWWERTLWMNFIGSTFFVNYLIRCRVAVKWNCVRSDRNYVF